MAKSWLNLLFLVLRLAVVGECLVFNPGLRQRASIAKQLAQAERHQDELVVDGGEEAPKPVRRSRFHRLEAEVAALERDVNLTKMASLSPKLRSLSASENLGEAARAKVRGLETRLAEVQATVGPERAGTKQRQPTKAWRQLEVGDVVSGECVSVRPFGAFIALDDRPPGAKPSLLHISEISAKRVDSIERIVPVGSRVTCIVAAVDEDRRRLSLSTRKLEQTPGDMLRDTRAVFANASVIAARLHQARKRRPDVSAVATATAMLAGNASLDDLDRLVAAKTRTPRPKSQNVPVNSYAPRDDKTRDVAESALSLAAAFQPEPAVKTRQREQEFELLMRDVIYESSSSLTDVSKLLRGRGKRGAFASPFWTRIFKPGTLDRGDRDAE